MLALANMLWSHGWFYSAVLVYMPVQFAYVMIQNSTLLLAALFAANRRT